MIREPRKDYAVSMSSNAEKRTQPDRRKAIRGGRRPHDQPGSAPLVLVVGDGHDASHESERILGELSFAVAPVADVAEALRVLESLQPDLIVARPEEAARLRAEGSVLVPIVESDSAGGGSLLERMRRAMRSRG
jgi:hypothetical protein